MDTKICLVTGSTSGIGKETAIGLAEMGHTVIVHGRDPERGGDVLKKVLDAGGGERSDLLLADFSSLDEVRHLVHDFKRQFDRLDVLVNNAGAWFLGRKLADEEIEMTFMVNHLAPFLLTNLLLDMLKESAPSRIVNVTSDTHRGADIEFDRVRGEDAVSGYAAYRQSKLANVLFTYELSKRLEGTDVTVNCIHPGAVRTRLLRDNVLLDVFWRLSPFFMSAEDAVESVIRLATSQEFEDGTGKYFSQDKERKSSSRSYDSELQKELWHISDKMVGLE